MDWLQLTSPEDLFAPFKDDIEVLSSLPRTEVGKIVVSKLGVSDKPDKHSLVIVEVSVVAKVEPDPSILALRFI